MGLIVMDQTICNYLTSAESHSHQYFLTEVQTVVDIEPGLLQWRAYDLTTVLSSQNRHRHHFVGIVWHLVSHKVLPTPSPPFKRSKYPNLVWLEIWYKKHVKKHFGQNTQIS